MGSVFYVISVYGKGDNDCLCIVICDFVVNGENINEDYVMIDVIVEILIIGFFDCFWIENIGKCILFNGFGIFWDDIFSELKMNIDDLL